MLRKDICTIDNMAATIGNPREIGDKDVQKRFEEVADLYRKRRGLEPIADHLKFSGVQNIKPSERKTIENLDDYFAAFGGNKTDFLARNRAKKYLREVCMKQ